MFLCCRLDIRDDAPSVCIQEKVNGSKMIKFGTNIIKTAQKGSNLAQTSKFDHILNLKYTCWALPSCFVIPFFFQFSFITNQPFQG